MDQQSGKAWVTRALTRDTQSHNPEAGPMTKITHFVGLDVHKDTISIAVAQEGRDPAVSRGTIPNDKAKLLKKLATIAPRDQIVCCYEAGPTGFPLYRYLRAHDVRCDVDPKLASSCSATSTVRRCSMPSVSLARARQ